ncbi:hypothetical protein IAT38_003911 [Cryptococcus sp. DSM 104549]
MSSSSPSTDIDGGGTSLHRRPSSHRRPPSPSHPSRAHTRDSGVSHIRSRSSISEDPELPAPPRGPSPPPPEANAPPPAEEVTRGRLAAHYAGLVLASMLGCLARLGLSGLGTYDGQIIYALAWSQGVGSGVMGLSLAMKNDIVAIYPPIYTFLTTGIAGSITTFSSWMLESYLAFSNEGGYNRGGLHDTVDGVAYSLSTFAIAIASLRFGEHLGRTLPALPHPSPETSSPASLTDKPSGSSSSSSPTPDKPAKTYLRRTPILDAITILSACAAYLIALLLYFLGPKHWRHDVTFPLLLSPPGTMLRFALSRVNTRSPFIDRFPLGTFIANMVATLLVTGTYAAQRRPAVVGAGAVRCNALHAIQQGFCGCLSTVSTFVVEAGAVRSWKWKWTYVGGSVVLGHIFSLAVVGGVKWSEGFVDVCVG